jgi:peptide chain release factor subunit 1
MLTPEQLDELEAFDGGEARVLSVYLDLDPARQVRRSYLTVFADLVKEVREKLTEPARAELSGEVLGKHDQGGLSQARYQRHHEAHVLWHLKRVAQRLGDLLRRRRFARLILAGPEEPTSELRRLLPRVLASRVVAVIPAEVFAEQGEILEKAREVEGRIEREAEERLLKELLDLGGPGGKSTLGVRPKLDALWADMVQTLVLAHDVHGSGSECTNCGRLEPVTRDACPTCGKTMQPLHDGRPPSVRGP